MKHYDFDLYKSVAEYFKALSHPTRIKIIELLDKKDMCVCEMMAELNLDQSHISRHLVVLKNNGIVKDSREGNKIFYTLTDRSIIEVIQAVKENLMKFVY